MAAGAVFRISFVADPSRLAAARRAPQDDEEFFAIAPLDSIDFKACRPSFTNL
jgi:hypothetical protein